MTTPPPEQIQHPKWGVPTYTYRYADAQDQLVGIVCRFDNPQGSERSKEIAQMTCTEGRWKWNGDGWPEKRPLYNLKKLIGNKDQQRAIIVEGEKCVDAAEHLLGNVPAVTWLGGTSSWQKADWAALSGMVPMIWPDNDLAGLKAALGIGQKLLMDDICPNAWFFRPPDDKPKGWDIADALEDGSVSQKTAAEYIASRKLSFANFEALVESMGEKEPEPKEKKLRKQTEERTFIPDPGTNPDFPFLPLGYRSGVYFYISKAAPEITSLTPDRHNPANLNVLAPIRWWEGAYPGEKGPRWNQARNDMICWCQRIGPFDRDRVRGRGAWTDHGKIVLNLGSHLIVDGTETPISKHKSRYIYAGDIALPKPHHKPLQNNEAASVIEMARSLRWEKTSMAYLF